MEFPAEHSQAHQVKEWLEWFDDAVRTRKLQEARQDELPTRVQSLRNWPNELTEVPKAAADQMDAAQLFKAQADALARKRENERNDQTIKLAVLEDKTALFQLVTEPMIHKAPLLRDYLKAECKIGSSDYYEGTKAVRLLLSHVGELASDGADASYYQQAEEELRKPANRLPSGCTPNQFALRVKR